MTFTVFKQWTQAVTIIFVVAALAIPAQATNRALLIGISDYSAYSHGTPAGNPPLFPTPLDCDADIARMKAVLTGTTFHFASDEHDMTILTTPEQTTRRSILTAFDQLIAATKSGDVVLIQYSGHGSQVPDPSKPTGLEDTIVPSDYKDDQTNEITGEEIRAKLAQLADKHPAQITVAFDSCHSGLADRGSAPAMCRGASYDDYRSWYKNVYGKEPPAVVSHKSTTADSDSALANGPWVFLAACSHDEVAWETDDNGVQLGRFTYCLTRALSDATPTTSYGQIFDQVRSMFLAKFRDQTPQLDGDPNLMILGGKASPPSSEIVVSPITGSDTTLMLSAGEIVGVTRGSTYDVLDAAGTKIAEATVSSVDVATSVLTIDKTLKANLTPDEYFKAHAVETAHNYPADPLVLDPATVQAATPKYAAKILDALKSTKAVTTQPIADKKPSLILAMEPAEASRGAALRRNLAPGLYLEDFETHSPLNQQPLVELDDLPAQIVSEMIHEERYKSAVSLRHDDPASGVSVTIKLVPAKDPAVDQFGKHSIYMGDATPVPGSAFSMDSYFTVEVTNRSKTQDLHVAVLDIESGGDVSLAWPSKRYQGQDNVIGAGQTLYLWKEGTDPRDVHNRAIFKCSTPDPHETFKVVATNTYVDLELLANKDKGERGVETPFDSLLEPAVSTRGTECENSDVPPTAWATSDVTFSIK